MTRADWPVPSVSQTRFTYNGSLPASAQSQYRLYVLGGAALLAPKDWTVESAGFGENGSISIMLRGPAGSFALRTDGYCAGCAVSDIGANFPGKVNWSRAEGFPSTYGSRLVPADAQTVALGADTLAASWDDGRTNAVLYGPTRCPQYVSAVITLPVERHETASTVLNFFHRITLPALSHACTVSSANVKGNVKVKEVKGDGGIKI